MIFWNVYLLLVIGVAIGVAFTVGSTWTERIILATVLCGVILTAFYLMTGSGRFGL